MIDESIEILKNYCENFRYTQKSMDKSLREICGDTVGVEEVSAIEALLTAYENLKSYNKGTKEALRVAEDLEHQANKEAGDWEARCFELEAELEKKKRKIKN